METMLQLAARNTERAKQIVQATDIINIWKSIGAEINLVGSLKMGLMMKHRDIDFHVYTPRLTPAISFQAITQLTFSIRCRPMCWLRSSRPAVFCSLLVPSLVLIH